METNPKALIQRLWDLGHFRRPGDVVAPNVLEKDLHQLDLDHPAVSEALVSFQDFMAPTLNALSLRHGKPNGLVDGELGPITLALLNVPRCGCPDYDPDRDGPETSKFNRAEANWPESCRGDVKTGYDMRLPGLSAADQARWWLEACGNLNADIESLLLSWRPEWGEAEVQIFAQAARLRGSTLAWSHLATSNCRDRLDQRYDNDRTWGELLFVTTSTHELGHALGMNHVRDPRATLYPSVNQASRERRGRLNDSDKAELRRIGYTIKDRDPDPDPDPEFRLTAEPFGVQIDGEAQGDYVILPAALFG